ncbi:hypothetical protein [Coleofasciculus sp.]
MPKPPLSLSFSPQIQFRDRADGAGNNGCSQVGPLGVEVLRA